MCGMYLTWNSRICSFGFPLSAGMPHGFFCTHGFLPCPTLMLSLGSSYRNTQHHARKNDEVMQHKVLEFRFTFTFSGTSSFGVSGNTVNFSTCSSFSNHQTNKFKRICWSGQVTRMPVTQAQSLSIHIAKLIDFPLLDWASVTMLIGSGGLVPALFVKKYQFK